MMTRGIVLCIFVGVLVGCSEGLGVGGLGYYGLGSPLGTWKTYKTYYSPAPAYPYYGGLGCLSCRPGAACLKAKLLKNYLTLKKPLCAAKPCYSYGGGLGGYGLAGCGLGGCGLGGLGSSYPSCGPCPYASCLPKCLKHKASFALCS